MIGLEAGVTAADHHIHAAAPVERRHPDPGRAAGRDDDRATELDVLEHQPAGRRGEPRRVTRRRQHRRRLRHRLDSEHRGEQQLVVERVVGQVQVAVGGQLGIGDQLDARVVDAWPVKEPSQRQLARLEGDRWQAPCPAHDHQRGGQIRRGDQLAQGGDAVVDRDRADALASERLEHPKPLAHAGAGPDRPLECQAAALRMGFGDLAGQLRQPVVGGGVVRLPAQPGAPDDAAEGNEQPQRVEVDCIEHRVKAGDLGRQRRRERRLVELGDWLGLVAARPVQQGRHRP